MWGATLADFYRVAALDKAPTVQSDSWPPSPNTSNNEPCQGPRRCEILVPSRVVTSSILRARYSPVIRTDVRHERLRRILCIAETEEEGPEIVPAYSVAKLLRAGEAWTAQSVPGGASWAKRTFDDFNDSGFEEGERDRKRPRASWEVDEQWPPESVFSPRAFPHPWPLEPFKEHSRQPEYDLTSWVHVPTLQQYIPQHLLPAKLIVHDPWEVLSGMPCTTDDQFTVPFVQKDDIVRVFNLSLDRRPRYDSDLDEEKEELDMEEARRAEFLACPRSGMPMPAGMFYEPRRFVEDEGDGTGPAKPPVYVVFPTRPQKVAPKDAHLYLAPSEKMGSGHHSYVYRAELEVPRSMLVEDVICEDCVREDVKRILEEEDGRDGEKRDPKWDDQTAGRYVLKVKDAKRREVMFGSEDAMCEWGDSRDFPVTDEQTRGPDVHVAYEGPYRAVQTTVGYQNLERAPYCEHLRTRSESIHPLTARVSVAAKLSSNDDSEDHMPTEALNYQEFPKHFFEHRTGYTWLGRDYAGDLYDSPVPSGAVVPQFYGYYQADWRDENNKNLKGKREHLSSILLLEDCGTPINPDEMTVDDRNECASLFIRMHAVGWIHNSIFKRNIVRQPGPLSEHPVIRRSQSERQGHGAHELRSSFRLIDFGRSFPNARKRSFSDYMSEERKMTKWLFQGQLL
ncbi:hypothetical protein JR316_0011679 [Psilocybe cubensis]|uniref:Protein kinase domain-containing protein n=2 Tax=Psilocybe cubensis TaxID=181762 RepID=A0A8H7XWR0_PSICU|nr:hypothetical protein JR316_0011679 [Psilocybe cubensis]KAH9476108.1 hypothetical protein JR316_0011679 [Psilocybe cubensis]